MQTCRKPHYTGLNLKMLQAHWKAHCCIRDRRKARKCTKQVTHIIYSKQNEPSQADDIRRHKYVTAAPSPQPVTCPEAVTGVAWAVSCAVEVGAGGSLIVPAPALPDSSSKAREANSSILLNSLVTSSMVSTLETSDWSVLLQLSRRVAAAAERESNITVCFSVRVVSHTVHMYVQVLTPQL